MLHGHSRHARSIIDSIEELEWRVEDTINKIELLIDDLDQGEVGGE